MKNRLIHQNLDTSFVNLSALVKYLRRRQFLGTVKVQLNGYLAEIHLKEENQIIVREHDQISGRISDGEEAFQRLLIRAREPGGSINVYQLLNDNAGAANKTVKTAPPAKPPVRPSVPKVIRAEIVKNPVPKPMEIPFRQEFPTNGVKNGDSNVSANGFNGQHRTVDGEAPRQTKEFVPELRPDSGSPERQMPLPDFPFDLSNSVEKKAKLRGISTEDWQTLLKLTVELLGVVDKTLAAHRLDFTAAFTKARAEISGDYPFMNPESKIFEYSHGRVSMTKQVNETIFVVSICEALGRIVERLGQNPKFSDLHRDTSHLIIAIINKRKTHYDRYGMTRPLERIVGL